MKDILFSVLALFGFSLSAFAQSTYESDTVKTSDGDLKMTFIGHGTLLFDFNGLKIHIDPVSRYADYSKLPKADIILITHQHGDHLDPDAIAKIRKADTQIIGTEKIFDQPVIVPGWWKQQQVALEVIWIGGDVTGTSS